MKKDWLNHEASAYLRKKPLDSGDAPAEDDWLTRPVTISEAVRVLREKPEMANELVLAILMQERKGSDESFLELIELLREIDEPGLADMVNRHALKIFRYNGDFYAIDIELRLLWSDARSAAPKIQKILNERYDECWSYRLGRAACDFYWHIAKISRRDEQRGYAERGIACARQLQRTQPQNEWGYYWEIELTWLISQEAACELFMKYLWRTPDRLAERNHDAREVLCCPRCCKLYIERVLSQTMSLGWNGEPLKQAAEKGLRYVTALYLRRPPALERAELEQLGEYFRQQIEQVEMYQREDFRRLQTCLPPDEEDALVLYRAYYDDENYKDIVDRKEEKHELW